MTVTLPQVVISRDGQRAVRLESFGVDLRASSTMDGFPIDSTVQLRPRGDRFFLRFKVSRTLNMVWNHKGQRLKWDEDFDTALPALALIALGRFLDENEVPANPVGDDYALTVPVTSGLFDIFKQPAPTDGQLRDYVQGKIFWTWKFDAQPTRFEPWEAQRLYTTAADFDKAAFPDVGILWEKDARGYTARPELVRQSVSNKGSGSTSSGAVYDVALSFAGEQRTYVSAVAAVLRDGGASVFYDDFADLWGKDLTKEFERVFRSASRFIVIFVSNAYVQKAWPNLERQHALAGRIERMDDSVLPARFDPIELPGLPSTVGYLDIGKRSPQELAALVLAKLKS
jgi:hypothetical protein